MLTQKDLAAIGQVIDQKLDKKLKPIHKKLDILTKFFDGEYLRLAKRVKHVEGKIGILQPS